MIQVNAHIGRDRYKTAISSSSGNHLLADEPVANGGLNLGFSPKELLASSLAACTCATVRMYADHKGWELEEIHVSVYLERDDAAQKTVFNRELQFTGNLDAQQLERLLAVANACPVHKILTQQITVNTTRK